MNRLFLILVVLCLTLSGDAFAGAPVLEGSALETLNKIIGQASELGIQAPTAPVPNENDVTQPQNIPYNHSLMFDETQLDQLYNAMSGFTPITGPGSETAQQQDKVTVDANGQVFDLAGNLLGSINENNVLLDMEGKMIGRVEKGGIIVDNEGNYLGRDTRVTTKVYPSIAPAFYLNSVMFYTPRNWTIWLNHRRIRFGKKMNGLTVIHIQKDFVDMLWKPMDLDFISPDWKKKLLPVGDGISTDLGVPFTKDQLASIEKELKEAKAAAAEAARQAAAELAANAALQKAGGAEAIPVPGPTEETPEQKSDAAGEKTESGPKKKDKDAEMLSLPVPEEESAVSLTKEEKKKPAAVDMPSLDKLGIDEATGEIKLDESKLFEELQNADEKKKKATKEAKDKEKEKDSAEQEKAAKKAEEEHMKYAALHANQEVDETKYKWDYKSPDGLILVDPINKMVKFRVGINQSFVSRTLEVKEGYVRSVRLAQPSPDGQSVVPGALNPNLEEQLFDYSNLPQQSVIQSDQMKRAAKSQKANKVAPAAQPSSAAPAPLLPENNPILQENTPANP